MFAREISERKQTEETRRQAELKYRSIFENAVEGIYQTTPGGRFISCNPALASIFGYADAEELMTHVTDAGHLYDDPNRRIEFIRQIQERGSVSAFESRARRRDGSIFWTSETARAVRDGEGEVVHYEGFIEDITQRRQADEALQRAMEDAEEARRIQGEFLANISHELRTPMNGILGMTELVLAMDLSPEQRQFLETVKSSADSLLDLIDDILDFSKLGAGKLRLHSVEFNLREALETAMDVLVPKASQKGLELSCNVLPDVPDELIGDPDRLRQVILNLAGNAVKFTECGDIVIHVQSELLGPEVVSLHFTVTDTGIGIANDKLELIFDAFSQADGSTTRKYGGTGLGLSISAQLVQMMDGEIWVDSRPEIGSAFHFTTSFGLPQNVITLSQQIRAPELSDLPILIVDDNPTNQRILQATLINWNMNARVADDGHSVLSVLKSAHEAGSPFALVILDAIMPGVDGFAVAQEIRSDPTVQNIPILMLTSAEAGECSGRCREIRVNSHLMKPIRQAELLAAIRLSLDGKSPEPNEGKDKLDIRSAKEKQATAPAQAPKNRLRILVAEDNEINLKLVTRLLEKRGHHIDHAGNGREVLAALEKGHYDLILMDVQMPEMDGLEATAVIRGMEEAGGAHTPILAMTAHTMPGDRERCMVAGMDGFISKPIRTKEFLEAVEGVAGNLRSGSFAENISPENQIIDTAAVVSRFNGDKELLREAADIFAQSIPRLLLQLRSALECGDADQVERTAHSIKGSVGNFGGVAAMEAALKLELLGRQRDLTGVADALNLLEKEIDLLIPAIAQLS
jgi:PAS domain S-box-containing protein